MFKEKDVQRMSWFMESRSQRLLVGADGSQLGTDGVVEGSQLGAGDEAGVDPPTSNSVSTGSTGLPDES